jgi:hypothetical protein
MRFLRANIFVLSLLLSCCADDENSLTGAVDAHRRQANTTFVECGLVTIGSDCVELSEPLQCIQDAIAACTPATVTLKGVTDEGASIPSVLFVEPVDGRCEGTEYVDHTEDQWKGNYPNITRRSCSALTSETCRGYELSDCIPTPGWN